MGVIREQGGWPVRLGRQAYNTQMEAIQVPGRRYLWQRERKASEEQVFKLGLSAWQDFIGQQWCAGQLTGTGCWRVTGKTSSFHAQCQTACECPMNICESSK